MIKFDAPVFMSISASLASLEVWLKGSGKPLGPEACQAMIGRLTRAEAPCSQLGLYMALPHIAKIKALLEANPSSPNLPQLARELAQRIIDQSGARLYLALSGTEARLYMAQAPFGSLVVERFPAAGTDIEEASRCLGFGRHTAGAFHCMRTVETGLKAVAKNLGIAQIRDDSWSWGWVLNQVKAAIDKNKTKKPKPAQWKEREPFLTEVHAQLQAVRTAWRNPTMHTIKTYTPEEAMDVFNATRGFMRQLAERMNEDGAWLQKPKPQTLSLSVGDVFVASAEVSPVIDQPEHP